jgi:enoyl-CoA hydratase
MSDGRVMLDLRDGVAWLSFDNQSKRNAINRAMLSEFGETLARLSADDAVRVLVLRGAGDKAFTSGADISELGDQPIKVRTPNFDEGFGVAELRAFAKPVIAMIHGFCMGGGLIMAMGADVRFGSDDSVYCVPTARLGVTYPIAAIERLDQLVGPAHASELLFTARSIDATEEARIGLINRVIAKADIEAAVDTVARQIVANAPLTVRAAKIAVREVQRSRLERDEQLWAETMRACMESDDFAEGRRAFMERRPPRFTGR